MKTAQHPLLHLFVAGLVMVNNVMASQPLLAPLGFALDITSQSDVRKQLESKTTIEKIGANRFTKGVMLKVPGDAFDIRGLHHVVFIFNAVEQLTAVNLTMDKRQFNSVFNHLEEKYQLIKKRVPFVGNRSARFAHHNATVVMDAPHLKFSMNVIYQTREFEKAYLDTLAKDKAKRQKKEKSAF